MSSTLRYLRPDGWEEDGVDAAELDVDLEAEVGEGLRRGLVHVLRLNPGVQLHISDNI